MYDKLKSEIKEILEIVGLCPDELKEKCFILLLENYFATYHTIPGYKEENKSNNAKRIIDSDAPNIQDVDIQQTPDDTDEEIRMSDFHAKVRRFLVANNIGTDIINDLYYKDNEEISPLYESLKSNKMTECQIRLALLTAFENSYSSGEMVFNGEIVRQRCQSLKCYDAPHFADTFKRHATYFDNWDKKYDKQIDYVLSLEGKRVLAIILRDIAQGV